MLSAISHVSPPCSHISVLQLFLLIVNINCVTPRSRIPLEKLTVPQLVVTFSIIYGTQISLPCSQQPAASLYTEPDQSSLSLATVFLEERCNTFPSTLRYPQLSLSFRFPHQNSVGLSLRPIACQATRSSHPPFQHPHNMPQAVQITVPLMTQISPAWPLFLPLAPNIVHFVQ